MMDMPGTRPVHRLLAIWLPTMSTDRERRQDRRDKDRIEATRTHAAPPGEAETRQPIATSSLLVLVIKEKNAMRIAACDAGAAAKGVTPGQTLADARALHPDLDVRHANPRADRRLIETLADWANRYTPLVGLDTADPAGAGLLLDITGCAHLFGGEAALETDIVARLAPLGFNARVGIADTVGMAWAAARHGERRIVPAGTVRAALLPLPLAALRLAPETIDMLARLGLRTVSQIVDSPRAPLAARFGPALLTRLDQALGLVGEAITPRLPVPEAIAERRFAEPIVLEAAIMAAVRGLAENLARQMEKRDVGARTVDLALHRVDGHVARLSIGTSRPLRDAERITRLIGERITTLANTWDAGFGYDMVRLSARQTESLEPTQTMPDDWAASGEPDGDLADLVDRLSARLGARNVHVFEPVESHIPERAVRTRAATLALDAERDWVPQTAAVPVPVRPLRLFPIAEPIEVIAEIPDGPPARFRWRRVLYRVAHAAGPERIAPEWWSAPDMSTALSRDYFRLEDINGHRYWVYREGLYETETDAPRWFMHGVFG